MQSTIKQGLSTTLIWNYTGVKKLLRNSLEKHNIKSPDMIFSSGVMDEVLRDIDNLACKQICLIFKFFY